MIMVARSPDLILEQCGHDGKISLMVPEIGTELKLYFQKSKMVFLCPHLDECYR